MKNEYMLRTNVNDEVTWLYGDTDSQIIEAVAGMMLNLLHSPTLTDWDDRPTIVFEVTQ